MMNEKQSNNKKTNNKFIKLLLLLGLVFLMYILQDVFHIKLNKGGLSNGKDANINMGSVTKPENHQILEEIREQMDYPENEELENGFIKEMGPGFKDIVIKKVAELQKKTKDFLIPQRLMMSIMQAKTSI